MYNRKKKGQATIEYLVLLAVAIIIALVIFAFMGWIPGFAGSLKERQVKLYWASQFPIQIRDYKVSNATGMYIQLQNVGDSKIEILNMTGGFLNDTTPDPSGVDARLSAGETKIFHFDGITCPTPGLVYELENISFGYNVIGGIQGMIESGDRELVGKCQ